MKDNMEGFSEVSGDPYNFLKFLDGHLGRDGNISESRNVIYILNIMDEAKMLTDRCMCVNILRATRNKNILLNFVEAGGWDTLYKWLQEARLEINKPLLLELLKLYKHLPVTVTLLKQNNCAKDIRQLSKCSDDRIESLSKEIVAVWMLMVKEISADLKKTDKPKPGGVVRSEASSTDEYALSELSSLTSNSTTVQSNSRYTDAVSMDVSETMGQSINSHTLNTTDHPAPSGSSTDKKNRPKTVKMIGSKMRSTGLELDTPLPSRKKSGSDSGNHRPSIEKKSLSLTVKDSSSVLVSTSSNVAASSAGITVTSPSTSSTAEQKSKIKLIPPKPKAPEIFESSGFMDAISTSDYTVGRRKRKLSISGSTSTTTKPAASTAGVPSDDKKPLAVPSFYRDTLLAGSSSEDTVKNASTAGSGTSAEAMDVSEVKSVMAVDVDSIVTEEHKDTTTSLTTEQSDKSSSVNETLKPDDKATSNNDVMEPASKIKKTKTVTWAEESKLCTICYFQLDETERVNVNKSVDFAEVRRHEQERERQMMFNVKRLHSDSMQTRHQWHKPRLITGISSAVTAVCSSTEKQVQLEREQSVLQVLYFTKTMIPDSPAEPETEYVEITDPKIIPLNDEMSGNSEETYEEYPAASTSSSSTVLPPGVTNPYSAAGDDAFKGTATPGSSVEPVYNPQSNMSPAVDTSGVANIGPYGHPMMYSEAGMPPAMMPITSNVPMYQPMPGPEGYPNMPMMPPYQRQPLLGQCPPQPFPMSRPRGPHPPFMGRGQICQHFLNGNCRYGDHCHHSHQVGPGFTH